VASFGKCFAEVDSIADEHLERIRNCFWVSRVCQAARRVSIL